MTKVWLTFHVSLEVAVQVEVEDALAVQAQNDEGLARDAVETAGQVEWERQVALGHDPADERSPTELFHSTLWEV